MAERPILFSDPMVRAILEGRKTQTRRVVKPRKGEELDPTGIYVLHPGDLEVARCPYGRRGDRLWVRESFDPIKGQSDTHPVIGVDYRATHPNARPEYGERWQGGRDTYQWRMKDEHGMRRWKPSIHMPRWASRILLEIVSVRFERLNNISVSDCYAEGIEVPDFPDLRTPPVYTYRKLWESINGPGSWEANPWVWVVQFNVIECRR